MYHFFTEIFKERVALPEKNLQRFLAFLVIIKNNLVLFEMGKNVDPESVFFVINLSGERF